jgi:hypothetical protein
VTHWIVSEGEIRDAVGSLRNDEAAVGELRRCTPKFTTKKSTDTVKKDAEDVSQ